jgi:ubiquinone/menaquinone biosynthesis C-methylase UbiE
MKMLNKKLMPPSTKRDFDKAYNSFSHWMWSDVRIPKELKELAKATNPKTSLELGCGLGVFSTYMAEQGIKATGVDFSSVAIEKAKQRAAEKKNKPTFLVGDVTDLKILNEPFDVTFDVGCFHCLNEEDEKKYASEMHRLLKPGGTLLIWALRNSPSGIKLNAERISKVFSEGFQLVDSRFSGRKIIIVASDWYWLTRSK